VAYWGWAKDFNRYVEEKGLPAPRVHRKTTLAFCILSLVSLVPWVQFPAAAINLALLGVFIAGACDGLNAIAPADDTGA
jgi:hypothetical protein